MLVIEKVDCLASWTAHIQL